jgi:hypothetical protein
MACPPAAGASRLTCQSAVLIAANNFRCKTHRLWQQDCRWTDTHSACRAGALQSPHVARHTGNSTAFMCATLHRTWPRWPVTCCCMANCPCDDAIAAWPAGAEPWHASRQPADAAGQAWAGGMALHLTPLVCVQSCMATCPLNNGDGPAGGSASLVMCQHTTSKLHSTMHPTHLRLTYPEPTQASRLCIPAGVS